MRIRTVFNRCARLCVCVAASFAAAPAAAAAQPSRILSDVDFQPALQSGIQPAPRAGLPCSSPLPEAAVRESDRSARQPLCSAMNRAFAQPLSRSGKIWAGSLIGTLAGAVGGAA